MANTAGDILLSLSNSLPQLGQGFSSAILQQNQLKRQAAQDQQDEEDRKRKAILDVITLQNAQQTNQKNALDIQSTQDEIQRKNDALKVMAGLQSDQSDLDLAKLISGKDKIDSNNYNGPFSPEHLSELGKMQEMKPLDLARQRLMSYGGVDAVDKYVGGLEAQQNRQDQIDANKELKEMQIQQQQATIDAENKRHQETLDNELKIASLRNKNGGKNGQIIGYTEDGDPIYGNASQRLSQNTVKSLTEFKNFPSMLESLRNAIKTEGDIMGPVQGRFQTGLAKAGIVTGGSKKAADLNSRYEAVKQVVAKGMEGGVLRAEDMPKYQKILGDITLKPEFAEQNLNTLENMLSNNYNAHLDGLKSAGYYVPKNYYVTKNSSGQPGTTNNSGNSNAHPQDDQAIQWAKSHPNDPRAAAILKANGL